MTGKGHRNDGLIAFRGTFLLSTPRRVRDRSTRIRSQKHCSDTYNCFDVLVVAVVVADPAVEQRYPAVAGEALVRPCRFQPISTPTKANLSGTDASVDSLDSKEDANAKKEVRRGVMASVIAHVSRRRKSLQK